MNLLAALEFPPVSHLLEWPDILFGGSQFALNKVGLIFIFAVAASLAILLVGGSKRQLVPRGAQNVAEASVDFIEEGIIMQTIGPHGLKYLPFLLSLFFFVLFTNITEIIPFVQFPANARMAMPATLALLVWFVFNIAGMREHGFFGYIRHAIVPPGVPVFLLPLVVLIELVSTFLVRPFSLAVRLFANMLAGHLLLVTFAVLCATLWTKGPLLVVLPLPFLMLIFLTAFEILVAFLQAFIFTILTAVYIGGAVSHEH